MLTLLGMMLTRTAVTLVVLAVALYTLAQTTTGRRLLDDLAAPPVPAAPSAAPPSAAPPPSVAVARAQLRGLRVDGRAARTGYTRARFGDGWADVDRDGCSTRADILRRDLEHVTVAGDACTVIAGELTDPYTGERVRYRHGPDNGVDIDHVVALADAWQKGAHTWPARLRQRFANDPANLLATAAATNRWKGAADAATWLPPREAFRCRYVATQISVKHRYRLSVTRAEHAAMQRALDRCPAHGATP